MPKRKMIEVGARRLDKTIDMLSRHQINCNNCSHLNKCRANFRIDFVDGFHSYSSKSVDDCKRELKRWLTCQK